MEDSSSWSDFQSSEEEDERKMERLREELRSVETDRPLWEELLLRKSKLLNSVDGIVRSGYDEDIIFKRTISAVGPVLVATIGSCSEALPIARTLGCTLVSYADVYTCGPDMDDMLCLEVVLEVASSQLYLGHNVVVDIPLSCSRKHVDRMLETADSCCALLIVIEVREEERKIHSSCLEETESVHVPSCINDINDIPMVIREKSLWDDDDADRLQFIMLCMDINSRCQRGVVDQSFEFGKGMLRHFSHRHPLVLGVFCAGDIEIANCCICTAPLHASSLCYACRSCNFFVHKSCAELPQHIQVSFHKHPLRLTLIPFESEESFSFCHSTWFAWKKNPFRSSLVRRRHSFSDGSSSLFSEKDRYLISNGYYRIEKGILSCIICDSARKRPFYRCWACLNFFIHYECATSAHDIDHQCHPHTLRLETYDFSRRKYIFTCCACGSRGSAISYYCSDCAVDFHVKCVFHVPHAALHKRHLHPLLLSASPEDEGNEYFCDICEKERHPDYWIYYCEPCRYEAHLSCANPEIPPYCVGLERLTHTVRRNSSFPCLSLPLMTADSRSPWVISRTPSPDSRESVGGLKISSFPSPAKLLATDNSRSFYGISRTSSLDSRESVGGLIHQRHPGESPAPEQFLAQPFADTATTDSDKEGTLNERLRGNCVHERILSTESDENVVPVIIWVKGHTCTGKSTVAQLLAKALRCTLLNYERIETCLLRAEWRHSTSQCLSYQVLCRMAETQLHRNHHVVINSPLSGRDQFERLLCLAERKDAILIITDCAPKDDDVIVSSLYKPALGKDLKALLERVQHGHANEDFDASNLDVPKLAVNTRLSIHGLEEQINDTFKKLILSCLVNKFDLEAREFSAFSECVLCRTSYIRSRAAHLPASLKHKVCGHEFDLETSERTHAYGKVYQFSCNACALTGTNSYYYCATCELSFHPECALELPLTVKHERHLHDLTLSPSPKDEFNECFCDVCEKERGPDDWIYYCQECLYEAHVSCVYPRARSFGRKLFSSKGVFNRM